MYTALVVVILGTVLEQSLPDKHYLMTLKTIKYLLLQLATSAFIKSSNFCYLYIC